MFGISAILSSITSLIGTWYTNYVQLQQAKANTLLEIEKNKARLAADIESNNHTWQMAALATSDNIVKRVTAVIFFLPLVVAWIYPPLLPRYFDALSVIPNWWLQIVVGISGTVWGILSLKDGVTKFIKDVKAPEEEDD